MRKDCVDVLVTRRDAILTCLNTAVTAVSVINIKIFTYNQLNNLKDRYRI